MREEILKILKDHAYAESNLSSLIAREQIADDIMKVYVPDIDYDVSAEHNKNR